ncbi:MAG: hypothetical protein AUG51_12090 [Acidobacteria bacterium 13_1_20CM_3_53_8]|nr:MAG: hypothetical protein AUG51_12090 [Acidobacteria bacterium 13_1_20CM_3_53_8]
MLIIAVFVCIKISGTLPSDSALTQNFLDHEAEFNKLLSMADENSDVVVIDSNFTLLKNRYVWPRPESELGFSRQRWDEYRSLFKRLNIMGTMRRSDMTGVLFFTAKIKSNELDDYETELFEKGYVYSPGQLYPLAESLDNEDDVWPETTYKKLKGNWYLYYDRGICKPE